MFSYILKKVRFWQLQNYCKQQDIVHEQETLLEFSEDLEKNLDTLKGIIGNSSDIVIRKFAFGAKKKTRAALIFIDGLIDNSMVNENIMKPLMFNIYYQSGDAEEINTIDYIQSTLISVGDIEENFYINKAVDNFLSGDTILLVDGSKEALNINLRGWKTRSIEEPKTESVVRGPREGFSESLRINTSLLRRKIKNTNLMFESVKLGTQTNTDVCIAYIKGIVNPKLIEEIKGRLKWINTDAILESGYIEQFIEDSPFSIFATIGNSEKPDKVAAKLLEGRAAILVDGTPFVLTAPMLFIESFQSAEDYYSRPYYASIIRLLRFISFAISILAPALYVALSTFHQELIPTPLLLSMAASHEGVPFPAVVEAGLMMFAFEILRESGVRLPRPIGQAVSIVGALVIGESAVSAGLVGAPMVIVVAITAMSSFVVTAQTDSGSILRFVLLILAGAMGGYGIAMGLFAVFIHMASLRSFGTPYLSPFAPLSEGDLKDSFIRAPIWTMIKRPRDIARHNTQRQSSGLKPNPPNEIKNESKK